MAKAESKAAAKIAEKKAKIAAKCGKRVTKCAALTLLAAACWLTGCATSDPSSRSTSGKYGDFTVRVEIDQREAVSNVVNVTVPVTLGDAAVASADSAGSTETTTATPTNTTDVKPDTDINTTGGRTAGVLESIVGAFGTWLATPSGKEAAAAAAPAATTSAACPGGNCGDSSGGACPTCTTCTDCAPSP